MSPTEKIIKQFKKSSLSTEDRNALISAMIEKLGAFPVGDLITFTENGLSLNGKDLSHEQFLNFKEACVLLKDNFARKVLNEQLKYKAIEMGIHKSTTVDELLFSKAVIWFINEENILIEKISTV